MEAGGQLLCEVDLLVASEIGFLTKSQGTMWAREDLES